MTEVLSRQELEALIATSGGPHVSLFMPTIRAGEEVAKNRIRLKNLTREAENQLLEMGMRTPDAQALLRPAEQMLGPTDAWLFPGDGLAIFLSKDQAYQYSLPMRLAEKLVVTDRFHIKPLIPLFTGDGSFFLLALSQNEIRLLQGSRESIAQVEFEPGQELDALTPGSDNPQQFMHWFVPASRAGGRDRQAAVIHATGGGEDDDQVRLMEFLRQVDKSLQPILRDEQAPLVLAGVEYLQAFYRQGSSYPHIVETGITGNVETENEQDLHTEAWKILEPFFEKDRKEAKDRYTMLSGQGSPLASSRLDEILPAAYGGRVEILFVPLGVQKWGTFDLSTLNVKEKEAYEPGLEDLLDRAAVLTIKNQGEVYALQPDQIPGSGPVAAIFRY